MRNLKSLLNMWEKSTFFFKWLLLCCTILLCKAGEENTTTSDHEKKISSQDEQGQKNPSTLSIKMSVDLSEYVIRNDTRLIINKHVKPAKTKGPFANQTEEFLTLVTEGHLSVDKTLFIKHVIQDTALSMLILCPKNWGKTTNLRMLESYLDIEVGFKGNRIPQEDAINYKFFQKGILLDGKRLENTFLISEDNETAKEYLGQWPVIYVDFSNIKGGNFTAIRNSLVRVIKDSYVKFAYIRRMFQMKKGSIDMKDSAREMATIQIKIDQMDKFLDCEKHDSLDHNDIVYSLYALTEIVHQHYAKQVFVLVDDYDSPFNLAHTDANFKTEDITAVYDLFVPMLMHLADNNVNVKKTILTGLFRLDKYEHHDLMFRLNLDECNFLENPIFSYYGVNQFELKLICQHMGISPEIQFEIYRWYSGFRAGKRESPLMVANFASLARYLTYKKFICYWEGRTEKVEESLPELMKSRDFFLEINRLVKGESTSIDISNIALSKDDWKATIDSHLKGKTPEEQALGVSMATKLAMKFLLFAGYLTLDDESYPNYVCIPNIEMYHAFRKPFKTFLDNQRPILGFRFQALVKSFYEFGANNHSTSSELEARFSSFFKEFPHFVQKEDLMRTDTHNSSVVGNEELVSSLILWIGMNDTDRFHLSADEAQFARRKNMSGVPEGGVFTVGSRGIICQLKYGEQYDLVNDTITHMIDSTYPEYFSRFRQRFAKIKDIKIIAVQVHQDTTTKLRAEILPARPPGGYTTRMPTAT